MQHTVLDELGRSSTFFHSTCVSQTAQGRHVVQRDHVQSKVRAREGLEATKQRIDDLQHVHVSVGRIRHMHIYLGRVPVRTSRRQEKSGIPPSALSRRHPTTGQLAPKMREMARASELFMALTSKTLFGVCRSVLVDLGSVLGKVRALSVELLGNSPFSRSQAGHVNPDLESRKP